MHTFTCQGTWQFCLKNRRLNLIFEDNYQVGNRARSRLFYRCQLFLFFFFPLTPRLSLRKFCCRLCWHPPQNRHLPIEAIDGHKSTYKVESTHQFMTVFIIALPFVVYVYPSSTGLRSCNGFQLPTRKRYEVMSLMSICSVKHTK